MVYSGSGDIKDRDITAIKESEESNTVDGDERLRKSLIQQER